MASTADPASPRPSPERAPLESALAGGGEMGRLIRAHDWSSTSLGPVEDWPQSLRTAVSIVLASGYPMAVCWGPDYALLYNDAYRPILGSTKHPAALGRPTSEVYPEIWDLVGPMFSNVVATGEQTDYHDFLYVLDRFGYLEECYFDFSYSVVRDESGGVGGIFVTCSETTARVVDARRLATLREISARAAAATSRRAACAAVVEALATDAADVPFALAYVPVDAATAELVAPALDAVPAWAPASLRLDGTAPWPLAAVIESREPLAVDVRAQFGTVTAGPWPEPVETAVALPLVPSGQADVAAVLVMGISPRRRLDDAYRGFLDLVAAQAAATIGSAGAYEDAVARADELAEVDRTKTEFFSNISHEFRTPLTLALAPLEDMLARGEEELAPEDRESVELAHRNMLRLLRLVNSLLDFSRAEAGRAAATFAPVDLARLTVDVASAFRPAVEQAGLRFVVDAPPHPERAYVDRDMWEKIVLNLISNAFKHTFEGEIRVSLRDAADTFVLTVADTGVGIPDDELDRVFDRFHRVHAERSRTHEGAGIGLALVRQLVEQHGGTIDVRSRPGEGSVFTVTIPRGRSHLPAEHVAPAGGPLSDVAWTDLFVDEALQLLPDEPAAGGDAGAEAGRPRVLVADDNRDMREYLSRLLSADYAVDTAADGREALASVRERRPDLVLTDVMMPELDGFGLLRELRADPATEHVPVIMLSARAGDEANVEGIAAGADDYVVKPFAARELLARVRTNLVLAHTRTEAAQTARLYDAAASAHERAVVVLDRIADHLRSTTELPGLFGAMARTVAELVQARRAAFWVVDDDHRVLSPQPDGYGFSKEELREMSGLPCRPDGNGPADELVYKDVVITPADLSEERFAAYEQWILGGGLKDIIATSWRAGGEPLGALAAYDSMRPTGFTAEDTWVLRVAAMAAGLVWLFKRTEGRLAELSAHEAKDLRREVERISRLEEAKSEFLRLASHELRGPLAVLRGYIDMIATGDLAPGAGDTLRVYSVLKDKADEMSGLVEHMLETARIDESQLVLDVQPLDLRAIVERAATLDTSLYPGVHQLDLDLGAEPLVVLGDAERIAAVIRNLIENAVKYSPEGGTVRIAAGADAGRAQLTVSDQGIGIDSADQPRLFKRFGRIVTPQNSHIPGTGLGLYISREIARLHGGDIELVSEPGGGTVVTLSMPLAPSGTAPAGT